MRRPPLLRLQGGRFERSNGRAGSWGAPPAARPTLAHPAPIFADRKRSTRQQRFIGSYLERSEETDIGRDAVSGLQKRHVAWD